MYNINDNLDSNEASKKLKDKDCKKFFDDQRKIANNNKKKTLGVKIILPVNSILSYKYIEYNREECINKYNEIYSYLKDNNYIPPRL